MSSWVLDSSMALAWGLPDERSPSADRFWEEVESGVQLDVPALWWYEVANALVVARRRERVDEERAAGLSALFAKLPLNRAPPPRGEDLIRVHDLAWKHGMSAYDAAYLDLAGRLKTGLATLDERLTSAAIREGLTVWQP